MALNSAMKKFYPEEHKGSVFEAFNEFVDEFQYEYDAIAKDPPEELESRCPGRVDSAEQT